MCVLLRDFIMYLSGIPCGSASPAGSSAAVMSGRRVSIKFTPLRMSSASVLGSSVHRLMVNSPACRHAETRRSDKSIRLGPQTEQAGCLRGIDQRVNLARQIGQLTHDM